MTAGARAEFFSSLLAVDDVSIRVDRGECVVILDANGAGKSSLLRGITMMTPIEPGGSLIFEGRDMSRIPPFRMVEEGIALVPGVSAASTEMTVDENLWLGSNPARAREGTAARRDEVLALFPRLAERRRQRVGTMSGGEQQMVAIARALMSKPDLLLPCEPSSASPPFFGAPFASMERIRDGVVSRGGGNSGIGASSGQVEAGRRQAARSRVLGSSGWERVSHPSTLRIRSGPTPAAPRTAWARSRRRAARSGS